MPRSSGAGSQREKHILVRGDRVEIIAPIPGHPELQPGKRGVVLLAADELEAEGLCTVRIQGRPGHHVWQLHPRDLRWLGPRRQRRGPAEEA
jgi:hypothetical protein